jgi:predicted AAA+ superfamily ATPase
MAWFAGYATTILQREVRDLANIDGLAALPRLLALVGARATTLLNTAELGRSAGIPNTTLKRYLALLQATFVAQLLPAWSANLGKRLVRSPKVMLCDTGLLAHLLGADARRVAADRGLLGPLLENLVAMELVKQAAWSEARPAPYHFRSHGGEDATRGVSAGLASPASGRAPSQARQGNVKRPVTRQRRYSAPASARASRPGLSSARPGAANPPGHHSP